MEPQVDETPQESPDPTATPAADGELSQAEADLEAADAALEAAVSSLDGQVDPEASEAVAGLTEATEQVEEAFGETAPAPDGAEAAAEAATTAQATGSEPIDDALQWLNFFKPEGIPYALVVLLLMVFVARFVSREAERLGERFADRRLVIQQTASFVRFLIYFVGLAFAFLTLFDVNEQLLLAIGGTLAVAAGFAMKDLVASIIAGVIILLDRPFQVGDRVTFAGYYGEITHIGLRSVRMMTLDDTQVTIPNNKFLTDAVASGNAGAVDMMIQIDLYIGADENLDEARRLLSEVVTTSRYVNLNRPWSVVISQVIQNDYFATRLRAKAYVLDARLEKAFQGDITERALDAFSTAGIRPPAVLRRDVTPERESS